MLAITAAVLANVGGASPTGLRAVDVIEVGMLGAALAVAASRARRVSWLVTAVLALWAAPTTATRLAAVFAVVLALVAVRVGRQRTLGAAAGAALAFVLGDLGAGPFHGSTALMAAIAATPVVVSGVRRLPDPQRRALGAGITSLAAAAVLATTLFGLSALLAVGDVGRAVDQAGDGFDRAADGEQEEAAVAFTEAADHFDSARAKVGGFWTLPARLVPVVGQHVRAVQVVTAEGVALTDTASDTARSVDVDDVRFAGGGLDLDLVQDLQPVLARTVRAVDQAHDRVDAARSPWLAAPIDERIGELLDELDDARPAAETASLAVDQLPTLLGQDTTVRWLVALVTPAEARGLGGLLGNWVVLEATDGRVRLDRAGRNEEVNLRLEERGIELQGPQQYVDRWDRFEVDRNFQDVTLSPDLPMTAEVMADLFTRAMDIEVDGVVVLDPYAVAAVLDLVGPIDAAGRRLDSDTIVDFLLEGQYVEYAGDELGRIVALDQVVDATVGALTTGDLPGPRAVADALGPLVEEDRLGAWWAPGGAAADLLADTGLDNPFPRLEAGGDLLGVVHQNAGQNKLDTHLTREIDYDLRVVDGQAEATVRVTLVNTLTDLSLPPAIVGSNDQGLAPGTNLARVAIHTPLALVRSRVDDAPIDAVPEPAFGATAISAVVDVPPGETRVWEVDVAGPLAVEADDYRLTLVAQPLVNADTVRASVVVDGTDVLVPGPIRLTEDVTVGPGGA